MLPRSRHEESQQNSELPNDVNVIFYHFAILINTYNIYLTFFTFLIEKNAYEKNK